MIMFDHPPHKHKQKALLKKTCLQKRRKNHRPPSLYLCRLTPFFHPVVFARLISRPVLIVKLPYEQRYHVHFPGHIQGFEPSDRPV
jgi:hypothetical protein